MKKLKLNQLSKASVPSSAIIIAISALINIIPGVSDAFTLITASSSGIYVAIYPLTMLPHLKYRKSSDFMADGYLMPAYKILHPLTLVFFAFIYISLFLQESTFMGAIGATIWLIVFGIYGQWKFKGK